MEKVSKSVALAAKVLYQAMCILRDNDWQLPVSELTDKVCSQTDLTEWEKEEAGKNRQFRWKTALYFYSIDYATAGFIRKESGTWHLTDRGAEVIGTKTPLEILEMARLEYRIKRDQNGKADSIPLSKAVNTEDSNIISIEDTENEAFNGIRQRLVRMDAYDIQDLVAALVRAMGYYTPYIAPRGKDGGIDIEVYQNQLGSGERLFIQVKHTPTSAVAVDVVRSLASLLKKHSDVGVVVTTGRFTSEATREARTHTSNIRLIDGDELIRLWIAYYDSITPRDKRLLPLRKVAFYDGT